MKFVFAAVPNNLKFGPVLMKLQVDDVLVSFYWFGPETKRKFLETYLRKK